MEMVREVTYYGQRWRRCSERCLVEEEFEMFRQLSFYMEEELETSARCFC